jgi:hypothetical protein
MEPVRPTPVCTSSRMKSSVVLVAERVRRRLRNSGRKWLSPPSPWIGSMMSAAMSSGCSASAWWIWRIASSSTAAVRASDSGVSGNESFGFTTRGQSNFGKYIVLRGSEVFVSESV